MKKQEGRRSEGKIRGDKVGEDRAGNKEVMKIRAVKRK